jgi:hypothetical protein
MSHGLCPRCSATVELPEAQHGIRCPYCGTPVTRQEAEGFLLEFKQRKASGALLIAEGSLASGSYEKALSFYNRAIEQDQKSVEAWIGRGICLAENITWENESPRIESAEAISSWETAIQFSHQAQ